MTAIKVGQIWRTRGGEEVKVLANDGKGGACDNTTSYPFKFMMKKGVASVSLEGAYWDEYQPDSRDLVELIQDVQDELPVQMVGEEMPDIDSLASETLQALGWHFNGQTWVQDRTAIADADVAGHPLYAVFTAAINQAMFGKGERHGGARTPFLKQPWAHYVNMHGRGFLTGQAAKKLEEAASTRTGDAFETEVFGAMVYLGMAVLNERGEV